MGLGRARLPVVAKLLKPYCALAPERCCMARQLDFDTTTESSTNTPPAVPIALPRPHSPPGDFAE